MGSRLARFTIQAFPAMRVIGKTIRVSEPTTLEDPTITDLWEMVNKDGSLELLHALPGQVSAAPDVAGWMGDFVPGGDHYTYLAGVLFQPGAPAPEGFEVRDIAAAEMAWGWVQGTEGEEGGDMMAGASGHVNGAREAAGYDYDPSGGLFEMEVYTYERFRSALERGEQPILDFYSPCAKKAPGG